MEEGFELLERLEGLVNKRADTAPLPMFTSCCPVRSARCLCPASICLRQCALQQPRAGMQGLQAAVQRALARRWLLRTLQQTLSPARLRLHPLPRRAGSGLWRRARPKSSRTCPPASRRT